MGAERLKEFFENKEETFENKTFKLTRLRESLEDKEENGEIIQVSKAEFDRGIIFLHTYGDITKNIHPDKDMPNWWQNMKHGMTVV